MAEEKSSHYQSESTWYEIRCTRYDQLDYIFPEYWAYAEILDYYKFSQQRNHDLILVKVTAKREQVSAT